MATSPMMQGFADSEMPDDSMTADKNPAGSVEYVIQVQPDGTMTAYVERPGADGAQQESERQGVATFGEGLGVLLQRYKANGPGDGDDAFQAGYTADEPQQQRPMGRNMSRGMA